MPLLHNGHFRHRRVNVFQTQSVAQKAVPGQLNCNLQLAGKAPAGGAPCRKVLAVGYFLIEHIHGTRLSVLSIKNEQQLYNIKHIHKRCTSSARPRLTLL
jgi:hypothetical protein